VSGIGEKMAENIVAYRSENGAFEDRNELKKVPRLGEKAFPTSRCFYQNQRGQKSFGQFCSTSRSLYDC
jgi:uncharacterized protein